MSKRNVKNPPFDKYEAYNLTVQSPESDVQYLQKGYVELRGKKPQIMREDFCAAFALCCEWVRLNENNRAIGIDLDPEPLQYGKNHYLPKLKPAQQKKVQLLRADVLKSKLPSADVVCALNFSYFIFKQREVLKKYFAAVLKSLRPDGVFFLDCFGGSQCQTPNEEETEYTDLKLHYFWDQDSFDPITHDAKFYIHFQRKGESKRKKVFTYDWRMWSIPELQDLLAEVGFKKSVVYWEGTTRKGEGNGIFKIRSKGEACDAWIAYIAALK